ncbi:hypothetical protein LTR17_006756 [Elasticomyces elasticus]|nr:hypothetical protein LTR17_006756 [Elasticomyces elasticus]
MAPNYCYPFQSGNCRRGGNCTYDHALDPEAKRTRCSYADRNCRTKGCPYLHNPSKIAPKQDSTNNASSTSTNWRTTDTGKLVKDWGYQIPSPETLSTMKPRALGHTTQHFCKQALDFVNGKAEVVQEVITRLASEGGCVRVTEIFTLKKSVQTTAQFSPIFDTQLLPFCEVITHKNVVTH